MANSLNRPALLTPPTPRDEDRTADGQRSGQSPREEIARILQREDHFLVAAHFNPDGDAIGSTAAMGWLLHALGKRFTLYNMSPLPRHFDWLRLPAPLEQELPDDMPGWCIALDSGDAARLGNDLAGRLDPSRTLVIDHHLGNPMYGAVNWVDTATSSVGEMVAGLAMDLGVPLTGPLAVAAYTAIVSDTGQFSYGNTKPETFELAAKMVRLGLDAARVSAKLQSQWSPERIRLWTRVLGGLETYFQGRLGVIVITKDDLAVTGTDMEDTDGLIGFVRSVRGIKVAASIREDGPTLAKFSLRSQGETDVQAVAVNFGGGGHKNAAGGVLPYGLAEAKVALVEAIGAIVGLA